MTIRIVQVGLGPIGVGVTRQLLDREGFEVVGAVDIDAEKVGRDLGDVCGTGRRAGVTIVDDLSSSLAACDADVAVLCTSSSFPSIMADVETIFGAGLPIVSTTEELAYPQYTHPEMAGELNRKATQAGLAILGTGVNPGFAMDYLAIAATGVCERVDTVRVDRLQDASTRRLPFQQKIGAGMQREEFEELALHNRIGHVGLTESIAMIAAAFGWQLDRITDEVMPKIAERPVDSGKVAVEAGQVSGLIQDGVGYRDGVPVIRHHMEAYLGAPETYDLIQIEGSPDLTLRVDGIAGDVATAAMAVNAVPWVLQAIPGLRTMADLPVACFLAGRSPVV